ncbi:MAG: type I DNA topoisomerase, partial [SAR324 cluster bacterium]|nr:type I DNA topoisomerase [SAR324 cluster bacterium]
HEITKDAIAEALENPRNIDDNLVKAQETRRIVDRLFGYQVSPLLWKKMAPRLSAGRVQSVALRLLVDRERERMNFVSSIYWDLKAKLKKLESNNDSFEADLVKVDGKRVASGKDFEAVNGKLKEDADVVLLDAAKAQELKEKLLNSPVKVSQVEAKPFTQSPYPPFTTSTLQQEGSRKLGFPARKTMSVAQTLYENGFITYMRTDSTTLSEEALQGSRKLIKNEFGENYLNPSPRIYKTKVRNAQEAHEAIRPAGLDFTNPEDVRRKLGLDAYRLYDLIWKRTLASQMKDAKGTRVSVLIDCSNATFRAAGKTVEFAGFLRAYVETSDDPETELEDKEKVLPKLEEGDSLEILSLDSLEHTTQAPARYTEGSLIKELEKRGIGRPSTWATIVDIVLSRTYAFKKGQALVPTFLALAVIGLMERYFTRLLDYEFTANLEDDLDAISRGEAENLPYLNHFYYGNGFAGLEKLIKIGEEEIDPREVCGIAIGSTEDGKKIEVRIGRFGPFLSDGENKAGLPEGLAPDELSVERAAALIKEAAKGPEALGIDPATHLAIYLKTGRFGPYIQLGENGDKDNRPKMVSLLPGMSASEVDFNTALALLSLPRCIGQNPENNEDITVFNGRYGPYIKCGTETRSIPSDMKVLELTVDQAVELLKQPRTRGRAASQPKNLRELGVHPESGAKITIRSGRYGPYVTDGNINASIPSSANPDETTLEDAIALLSARAERLMNEVPKEKTKKSKAKKASTKKKTETKKKSSPKSSSKKSPTSKRKSK